MFYNQSLVKSFKYAFEGVLHAFKFNRNIRIHAFAAFIVVLMGLFFQVSLLEASILGVLILIVIASEMINTAIEEMVNLITNEHRREAKIAKDVSAGMVLVTSIGSVVIGIMIFAQYIARLF